MSTALLVILLWLIPSISGSINKQAVQSYKLYSKEKNTVSMSKPYPPITDVNILEWFPLNKVEIGVHFLQRRPVF